MTANGPILRVQERAPIPAALKRFIWDIQSMVELAESEREIIMIGRDLMTRLISSNECLPAAFSVPSPGAGRQFQIYRDGMERFCAVSTILAGGAALSISQPAVWEIMGVVSGAIHRRPFDRSSDGLLLRPGSVDTLRSQSGDAFRLSNALGDQVSIVIHVYGGEIDRLSRRLVSDGTDENQSLGYANDENAPPYDIFSIQTEIRD